MRHLFIILAVIISIGAGLFISLNINSIIAQLLEQTRKLVFAAKDGRLNIRSDPGMINFEFREIVVGFNETLDAIINPLNMTSDMVKRIAKGDIPERITQEFQGDFNSIKNSLNQCIDAINLLIADANKLAKAAAVGDLEIRADEGKHDGDFRKVVDGLNSTLANVAAPFKFASSNIKRISVGRRGVPRRSIGTPIESTRAERSSAGW